MVYLCTVTGAIGSNGITVLCHGLRFFGWAVHEGEKVMEIDDGDDGKTKCFLYILNCLSGRWGIGRAAAFHTIYSNKDAGGGCIVGFNNLHRFPH